MTLPPQQPRQRAVVTGGAGFLGSHLCERLLTRGFHVICLDNLVTGSAANVSHLTASPYFGMVNCDITEGFHIDGAVNSVFHLASPASPADYLRLPIQTLRTGSVGTINVLELAREKKARFLLGSSSEVYGDPLQHPQQESYWGHVNPIGPRSSYDEAKRFAEATAAAYLRVHHVNIAIARIFNSYGPRMRPGDGRAIPTFIRQALRGEPVTVAGDGHQTRSFCYVDDTIDGILALADSVHPGPVNIGSHHEMTVLQIATMIRDATGSSSPIRFVPRPADDPSLRRPDTTRARTLLGWEAGVQPAEGLRRTIAWFAEQHDPATPSAHGGRSGPDQVQRTGGN
jgi:dTDP-glucose 4,6-dehydratase